MSTEIIGTATNTFLSSGYVIVGSNIKVLFVFVQATHSNKNITNMAIANKGTLFSSCIQVLKKVLFPGFLFSIGVFVST